MMFWLISMFHRIYLTDSPEPTLRTSPLGLISCAGIMDGWVRSISNRFAGYVGFSTAAILCSISGTCRFVCFSTSCYQLSAVITSLPRLGWEPCSWPHTPGPCDQVVGFCGSLLGNQVPSTAIPGPAGLCTSFYDWDACHYRLSTQSSIILWVKLLSLRYWAALNF